MSIVYGRREMAQQEQLHDGRRAARNLLRARRRPRLYGAGQYPVFDLPSVSVYAGPEGSTTETDPGVQPIDVTAAVAAGTVVTEPLHLTLADGTMARAFDRGEHSDAATLRRHLRGVAAARIGRPGPGRRPGESISRLASSSDFPLSLRSGKKRARL